MRNNKMKLKIFRKILLSNFSTFKIGGVANFLAKPADLNQIYEVVEFCTKYSLKPFFFGSGANILFPDNINKDIFFISLRDLYDFDISNDEIYFSSGFPVSFIPIIGFNRLFFLYLLPGTLGASVYMNAKYNEFEIGSFVYRIEYLDLNDLKIKELKNENCNFGYKKSIFQNKNWIILKIYFEKKSILENIEEKMKDSATIKNLFPENYKKNYILSLDEKKGKRIKKMLYNFKKTESDLVKFYKQLKLQNIEKSFDSEIYSVLPKLKQIEEYRNSKNHFLYPSCGSVFKNNYNFGTPIGALVDKLGLKGYRYNDAQIAPFHGNIIINLGKAKAEDVKYLISFVQQKINDNFGFVPEPEIFILNRE